MSSDDAQQYLTLPDTSRRKKLWDDWLQLTDALRDAAGRVPACWLAGSFFTGKDTPGDLDCLFLLAKEDLDRVAAEGPPQAQQLIQLVAGSQVKSLLGLELDTYVLPWWPRPGVHPGSADRQAQYLQRRGYWDDLWCRHREGDASAQKLPRRGYLEVIVDGFA